VRWIIVGLVGAASAGLIVVSITMNFAFGSSFGATVLESYAYGAAFGLADILKVAAPIAAAGSFARRNWMGGLIAISVWGTFTICSVVSAIGFASANRSFTVDTRKVQAALNQSRLTSLEADQSELRRVRERLAAIEIARGERAQLVMAAQRLEAAISGTRGRLEDAAPIVTTPNPQAHTLAGLTGASMDKVETTLVLLVALLVEMGGLGPFITMSLAKGSRRMKVPAEATDPFIPPSRTNPSRKSEPSRPGSGDRPRLVFSAEPEDLKGDLRKFLNLHTQELEGSALGSSGLLARFNSSRGERGLAKVSQRRFGDAMMALGHCRKVRLSGGHVHYQGLSWLEPAAVRAQVPLTYAHAGGG
jgi:hypothetical protein